MLEKYLLEKANTEKKTKQKIIQRYKKVYKDFKKQVNVSEGTLTESYLRKTGSWLKDRYTKLSQEIEKDIKEAVKNTIKGYTDMNAELFSSMCEALSMSFEDMFSKVNENALKQVIEGNIYKDKISLSKRLWSNNKTTLRTIDDIILDGMIAKKNSKDIAKDLEVFVNPDHAKEYDLFTIHPKSKNKVEFNSYRLANTYINHAYQTASKESAKKNPYVEKIIWLSGDDDRVCDLCKERNGQKFDKDKVPLDHPLGRCTYLYDIEDSLEDIGKELTGWYKGEKNEKLDNWFNEYGVDFVKEEDISFKEEPKKEEPKPKKEEKKEEPKKEPKKKAEKKGKKKKLPTFKKDSAYKRLYLDDFKKMQKEWTENLSDTEKEALKDYCDEEWYHDINGKLRGEKVSRSKEATEKANLISESLQRNKITKDIRTYRGTSQEMFKDYISQELYDKMEKCKASPEEIKEALQGTIIKEKSFVSTTANEAVANNFYKNVILNIDINRNSSGLAFMGQLSKFQIEAEVLMDKGTELYIKDLTYDPDRMIYYIDCHYLGQ